MNVEKLKFELNILFGKQIVFNKEFDNYAQTIKNLDENLLEWCKRVKNQELPPAYPKKAKESVVFIKKIGSSNRCIVIKIKNGIFSEIHLGDHNYYDKLRKRLGLKEDSI